MHIRRLLETRRYISSSSREDFVNKVLEKRINGHRRTWIHKLEMSELPNSYSFTRSLINSINNVMPNYSSFSSYFSDIIQRYGKLIYIDNNSFKRMHEKLQIKDNSANDKVREIIIFNQLRQKSVNSRIISERLKIERLDAPFYMHQQFSLNLEKENIESLLDLYFDLPNPKSLHLKRQELEKFLSLLIKTNFKEDKYRPLAKSVIDVFEDILNNDKAVGIQLTNFEKVKYFSLLVSKATNRFESHSTPPTASEYQSQNFLLKQLLLIQHKIKLHKSVESYISLAYNFPNHNHKLAIMMSRYLPLNRLTVQLLIKNVPNWRTLQHMLRMIEKNNIHIDYELLNLILEQYIRFKKSTELKAIVFALFEKFGSLKTVNQLYDAKSTRQLIDKYHATNLASKSLKDEFEKSHYGEHEIAIEAEDQNQWDQLIPYPILPSPELLTKFLSKFHKPQFIIPVIELLKIHHAPVSYNAILFQLENGNSNIDLIRIILNYLLDSQVRLNVRKFNEKLTNIGLQNYRSEQDWLMEILKHCIKAYENCNVDDINIKDMIVQLDELLK